MPGVGLSLKRYPPSVDVTLVIPYVDENGAAVVPTAVSYRIIDESGDELLALTSFSGVANTSAAVA